MGWSTINVLQSMVVSSGSASLFITTTIPNDHMMILGVWKLFVYLLTANIILYGLYSALIYPELIDPLRLVPRAKRWLPDKVRDQLLNQSTTARTLYRIAQETPNDGLVALREITGISLLVTKPHVMAELLVTRAKDISKPEGLRKFLTYIAGNGILSLEGDEHRYIRKKSLAHFNVGSVKKLYPLMWHDAQEFARILDEDILQRNAGKVEISQWTEDITNRVIGKTVFGWDFEASGHDKFGMIVDLIRLSLQPSPGMQLYICLVVLFSVQVASCIMWKTGKIFSDASAAVMATSHQLVKEKKEVLKKADQDIASRESQHVDLLSNMIRSDNFSDDDMAAALITYMIAGQDTTAGSLTWTFYMLALDQERQNTLRREVFKALSPDAVTDTGSGTELGSVLERLPFLNGVISETLRLYPAVPVTKRTIIRDTILARTQIPQGTEIVVSPWIINRSTELWGPAANEFIPERWISVQNGQQKIDSMGGSTGNYDFLTFLQGSRTCIGRDFSKAEMRCIMVAMVMHFEWSLDMDDKDVTLGGAITIKPKHGLHLQMRRVGLER